MNIGLVFAGGSGQRMRTSAKPKQFLEVYGKPIIIYTLEAFEQHQEIDTIVVPCIKGWEDYLQNLIEKYEIKKVKKILTGGNDTQESKMIALNYLNTFCKEDDIVLLHDAVRPLITEKLISDNIASVKEFGNGITAVPFTETAITPPSTFPISICSCEPVVEHRLSLLSIKATTFFASILVTLLHMSSRFTLLSTTSTCLSSTSNLGAISCTICDVAINGAVLMFIDVTISTIDKIFDNFLFNSILVLPFYFPHHIIPNNFN